MKRALGLIETRGLVAAIAAADRALKTANVTLEGKEITEPGYVTIKFTGELNEIQMAVSAGAEAARDTGELISSLILSQPEEQLALLFNSIKTADQAQEKKRQKNKAEDNSGEIKLSKELKSAGQTEILPVEEPVTDVIKNKVEESALLYNQEAVVIKNAEMDSPKVNKNITAKKVKSNMPAPEKKKLPEYDLTSKLVESANDTITRLRMEAFGKARESGQKKKEMQNKGNADPVTDLEKLNVHQLRKLARNTPDFPLYGRQISKANRDELIKLLNK